MSASADAERSKKGTSYYGKGSASMVSFNVIKTAFFMLMDRKEAKFLRPSWLASQKHVYAK